jgi:hypothetical protein
VEADKDRIAALERERKELLALVADLQARVTALEGGRNVASRPPARTDGPAGLTDLNDPFARPGALPPPPKSAQPPRPVDPGLPPPAANRESNPLNVRPGQTNPVLPPPVAGEPVPADVGVPLPGGGARAAAPAARRWEYRLEFVGQAPGPGQATLDRLGDEGWELVAVTATGVGYFKRPKR